MDVSDEAEMLQKVPLFSGLSASERKLLAFTSQLQCFAPGDALMQPGELADCAYVILEGEAEVLAIDERRRFRRRDARPQCHAG